jgi:DNA primase
MVTTLDAAAQIKSHLSIQEACERYGVHFDSRSRALCPFHNDSHPSGSIKNNLFHCYVCDLHLDIFSFTMRVFDINFSQAILRLNEDFGLGLCGQKPDRRALERFRCEQADKAATLAACRAEYDRNVELHRYIFNALHSADKPVTWRDKYRVAIWKSKLEYLEWWFEVMRWR